MSLVKITSNAPELVKILKGIPKAMQQVTAATLNDTARAVQVRSERNLKKDMIVRTPYTLKSLKTYKASPGRPIERQDAVTGTISDYLPVHDEGGNIKARGKRIAIPTNRVRGRDRKRKVGSKYRLDGPNRSKMFALYPTLADAGDSKNWGLGTGKKKRPIYGRKRKGKMIAYRLSRPAIFMRQGKKLVKVRDLGESTVRVKGKKWHSEAVKLYGNYQFMNRMFQVNAKKYLASLKTR